ncbi:MAG: DUF3795 domain-containing protein [Clostridiaceae bacterium]|nr:DUF3795 domain-containing protein [Clostridiaceae bacterium]
MSKLKMAACGIDCNECASYKVTMNQDLNAAELIVEWYRSRGWIGQNEGAEAVVKKSPLCNGCWNSNDDCFFKCGCHMLTCCKEKQINHCGECNDFPCEHYKEFASGHEVHKKAMEHLLSLKEK